MSQNENISRQDKEYQIYLEERKELVSSSVSVSERLDKWIIGLPAGIAGFSLLFYEKVIGKSDTDLALTYLIFSWAFLCIAISAGFFSLYGSTNAVSRQIEVLDSEYEDENSNSKNRWRGITSIANLVSVITSLIALILIMIFAFSSAKNINLNKKEIIKPTSKEMSNEQKPLQKGAGHVPPKNSKPPKSNSKPPKNPK